MNYKNKIKKALNNPKRAKTYLFGKLSSFIVAKEFSSSKQNRSDSEDGLYVRSINKFLNSQKSFRNFKQDPFYQNVLEHATKEGGQNYLKIILDQAPSFLHDYLDEIKQNDELGNPTKFTYDLVGSISPTTLHYVKIASDLKILFGNNFGKNIAEIGVGYGGQALILDTLFNINKITLFDLFPVTKLVSKYLEHFVFKGSFEVSSLNQAEKKDFDLVISNYAFSEVPKNVQLKYIEKVLANSKRGYLIMNSGGESDHFVKGLNKNRLRLSELEALLPKFEIKDENPLTSPHNYLIVWGHDTNPNNTNP